MSLSEVETHWDLNTIVEFMTPQGARHVMHLSVEKNEYYDGNEKKVAPSFTLTCTTEGCPATIGGLQNAAQVFAVIQDHCEPL